MAAMRKRKLLKSNTKCECGCGEATNLAPENDASKGWVRGQPLRFIRGHGRRKHWFSYQEEDRGHTTPCWIWGGNLCGPKPAQYGVYTIGGKLVAAHRYSYEQAKGEIPDGLQIDHLCQVTECVNPDHLEAVTQRENMRRGTVWRST